MTPSTPPGDWQVVEEALFQHEPAALPALARLRERLDWYERLQGDMSDADFDALVKDDGAEIARLREREVQLERLNTLEAAATSEVRDRLIAAEARVKELERKLDRRPLLYEESQRQIARLGAHVKELEAALYEIEQVGGTLLPPVAHEEHTQDADWNFETS